MAKIIVSITVPKTAKPAPYLTAGREYPVKEVKRVGTLTTNYAHSVVINDDTDTPIEVCTKGSAHIGFKDFKVNKEDVKQEK